MCSIRCMQYTDAGLYTCSQGGRSHKIPGSYGTHTSHEVCLIAIIVSTYLQVITNGMLKRMVPWGCWNGLLLASVFSSGGCDSNGCLSIEQQRCIKLCFDWANSVLVHIGFVYTCITSDSTHIFIFHACAANQFHNEATYYKSKFLLWIYLMSLY